MKTVKLLFLLLAATLSFAPAARAGDALKPNEKQMVGLWEEYSPGSNCVEFLNDHSLKIYLTEEEGRSDGGDHFVPAKWSLDKKNVMTLVVSAGGKSSSNTAQAVFKHGELWLVESDGSVTKHRRIKTVPAKYRW